MSLLNKEVDDITPYIGKHGEYEPQLCAYSSQKAPRDRACTNVGLGNGFYYRLLAKDVHRADKEAIAKKLEKGMNALAGKHKVVRKGKGEDES